MCLGASVVTNVGCRDGERRRGGPPRAQLPEVVEGDSHGHRAWSVAGKAFAWSGRSARPISAGSATPLRRTDRSWPCASRTSARGGGARHGQRGFFTIPHFDGYAAVLIQLRTVTKRALRDALVDGWLACAPTHLADDYSGAAGPPPLIPQTWGGRPATTVVTSRSSCAIAASGSGGRKQATVAAPAAPSASRWAATSSGDPIAPRCDPPVLGEGVDGVLAAVLDQLCHLVVERVAAHPRRRALGDELDEPPCQGAAGVLPIVADRHRAVGDDVEGSRRGGRGDRVTDRGRAGHLGQHESVGATTGRGQRDRATYAGQDRRGRLRRLVEDDAVEVHEPAVRRDRLPVQQGPHRGDRPLRGPSRARAGERRSGPSSSARRGRCRRSPGRGPARRGWPAPSP